MIRIKCNFTDRIVYFRFFSEEHPGCFWHTESPDVSNFAMSKMKDWTPIGMTWKDVKHDEL